MHVFWQLPQCLLSLRDEQLLSFAQKVWLPQSTTHWVPSHLVLPPVGARGQVTHCPPHDVSLPLQPQLPSIHATPGAHALSQRPQFFASLGTQPVSHASSFAPQPQLPPLQVSHCLPHMPQLFLSERVSTQTPLHSPLGHTHAVPLHVLPPVHATQLAPQ